MEIALWILCFTFVCFLYTHFGNNKIGKERISLNGKTKTIITKCFSCDGEGCHYQPPHLTINGIEERSVICYSCEGSGKLKETMKKEGDKWIWVDTKPVH